MGKRSSRRKRHYTRSANDNASPVVRVKPNERGLFAADGYTNQMAYIGEASDLMQAGTYTRHGITNDTQMLTTLYRENWIAKRIIDVPSQDMTRSWYTLNSQLETDKLEQLSRLEKKHDIKGELTCAIKWARLYGGSAILIVVDGQQDMLDEPLDLDMLQPDCFRGLMVIDRWMGLEPSLQIQQDMDDVDFGYPKFYDIYLDDVHTSYQRVHHSRLIIFRGRDLPHDEEVQENYFGASELEHIYEQLQKRNTTSANIAQLVFQANVRTLKMSDFGELLAMGTQNQRQKILDSIQEQNRLVSNFGLQVLSAQDSFENHPYSFQGLSDVYEKFMADMAGAAEMPATKLYGRSPDGMNATGESDMVMYYESIAQKQERMLRPALERLIPIMCISLFGAVPDDFEVVFEPIATVSASEKANIGGQITGNVVQAFNAGLIGRKTALLELRENGKELGIWQKISDETIEQADDEVDQGEGGEEDPMAAMMGGDPNGGDPMAAMMGGGMPETPAEQPQPKETPAKAANQPSKPVEEPKVNKQSSQAQKPAERKSEANNDKAYKKLAEMITELYGRKPKQELKEEAKEEPKAPKAQEQAKDDKPGDEELLQKLIPLIRERFGEKKTAEQQAEVKPSSVQVVVQTLPEEPPAEPKKRSWFNRLFRRRQK